MAIGSYIPSVNQAIKVIVTMLIVSLIMKTLPVPENIKELFRV